MRHPRFFVLAGTTLSAFLLLGGTAFAHDVTGAPLLHPCSPDSPQAGVEVTLANFPGPTADITVHGTVNGTPWVATSTLTGTHGTVVFDVPENATSGEGSLHLTVDTVSWTADGGKTVPLELSTDMVCHQRKPVTPPTTVTPQAPKPPVPPVNIGTPATLTKPAMPAPMVVHPAVVKPASPALAFTGAREDAETLAGGVLIALGLLFRRQHRTDRRPLLEDTDDEQ